MKNVFLILFRFFGSFKIIYEISRLIIQTNDNDRNENIHENGELNLIQFLAHSDLFFLKKTNSLNPPPPERFYF